MNIKRKDNTVSAKEYYHWGNFDKTTYESLIIEKRIAGTTDTKYSLEFRSQPEEYPLGHKSERLAERKDIMDAVLKDANINIDPNNIDWIGHLNIAKISIISIEVERSTLCYSNRLCKVHLANSVSAKVIVPNNFLQKYLYIEYETKDCANEHLKICVRYKLDYQKIEEDWKQAEYPSYWGFTTLGELEKLEIQLSSDIDELENKLIDIRNTIQHIRIHRPEIYYTWLYGSSD